MRKPPAPHVSTPALELRIGAVQDDQHRVTWECNRTSSAGQDSEVWGRVAKCPLCSLGLPYPL